MREESDKDKLINFHQSISSGNLAKIKAIIHHNPEILQLRQNQLNTNITKQFGLIALHNAVLENDLEMTKILLNYGISGYDKDIEGKTAIHLAALKGHNHLIDLLLFYGVSIQVRDLAGKTAMHYAALGGHNHTLKLLASNGLSYDVADEIGRTPMHFAALKGYNHTITFLASNGLRYDIRDKQGNTIIHHAAFNEQNHTISFLITQKVCDINTVDHNGLTPLHKAASNGKVLTLALLIEKGAESLLDNNHATALHYASEKGNNSSVQLLANKFPKSLFIRDIFNKLPIDYANSLLIKEFLRKNMGKQESVYHIRVDECNHKILHKFQDSYHNNSLTQSCAESIPHTLEIEDLSLNDYKQLESLMEAIESNDLRLINKILSENPQLLYFKDNLGSSILHYAVISGNIQAVQFLMNLPGADFKVKDNYGSTLLDYAEEMGYTDIIELLRKNYLNVVLEISSRPTLSDLAAKIQNTQLQYLKAQIQYTNLFGENSYSERIAPGNSSSLKRKLPEFLDIELNNENTNTKNSFRQNLLNRRKTNPHDCQIIK